MNGFKRVAIALGLVLLLGVAAAARGDAVTVSAAISLRDVLDGLRERYESASGDTVRVNVGGSGQLMEQVRNGAPVDLFISAAPGQIDELERAGLLIPGSRRVVARNRLVLIVPASVEAKGFEDLREARFRRVAVGRPKAVPAGDYAMQVFESLKMTKAVRPKLVYGANVRQVLDYVRRGEVDAGVVYRTDAVGAGDAVKVVATADEGMHRPIEYEGAVIRSSASAGFAERFLAYLLGDEAQRMLQGRGFGPGQHPATRPRG